MADITALLAGAAKTNANFNFDELGKSYWGGLEEAYKRRTRDAFQDPSLYDAQGNIDPAKALSRALQAGGLQGAESAAKIGDVATQQTYLGNAARRNRELYDRGPQAGTEPPIAAAPSISQSGAPKQAAPNLTEPQQRQQTRVASPQAPGQQTTGPFDQFLAFQKVPQELRGQANAEIQKEVMLRTGRPFDIKGMNDPATREHVKGALATFATKWTASGQAPPPSATALPNAPPPQATPFEPTRVGSGPVLPPAPAGAPGMGSGAAQAAIPPQGGIPPQAVPPPVAVPPQAAPPQQAPIQPRVVQTETIHRPAEPIRDPTLGGVITPQELRRFGTPERVKEFYEQALAEGLPKPVAEAYQKKVDAIRKQQELTETQKNAAAAGQGVREFLDQPEKAKQGQAILEKTAPVLIDSYKEAKTLRDSIASAHRAREQLDSKAGVVTGAFAKDRLMLLRIASVVGIPSDKITATETFNSEMSRRIQEMASSLPGVLSDKDIAFLSSIGGTSELSENTLRTMLDISEKVSREKIKSHNERLGKFTQANEAMTPYKSFYEVSEPGAYRRKLNKGDVITNPQNGKRYQFDGTKMIGL